MNKDDSTTEDNLREEYLKVRKLGSERKIFNKITTLFRLPSNDSIRKSQKIENKILERINNPAIICKVILDKDDDVEIKFEQKTKNEVEIKDIYLCEALKMAEENTHEHQDINVFIKDDSGNFHEIFSLKKEMDLHKSMGDILSYYPRWYNRENFKRKQFIAFLRARQAAKQLARYEKEDLQQQKFVSEHKSNSITQFTAFVSWFFIVFSIIFVGYPGFPESSIVSRLSNSSVNYKTCKIIKKGKDTEQKDRLCKLNKAGYELGFLLILSVNLLMSRAKSHCTNDLLIINHALDISSGEPPRTDEPQH